MIELPAKLADDDRQDSDYDGAWKAALRLYLRAFIEQCFPDLAELIDWSFEPEWLDKEISQIIGQSGHRNREVDVLFKVRLKSGAEQWILCHLEIQTSYEADFAFRVDLYNAGLKWLFRQNVLTLVILADLRPDWRPCEHHFELAGFESRLRFPICKILDRLETDWAENTSLPAQVARAQVAALRTAGDPEARYHAKTQLVRNLYSAGYSADDLRELFRFFDWMMHLNRNFEGRFKLELQHLEQELHMNYVTSIERLAKIEGREEGRQEGRAILLRLVTHKCGKLPDSVRDQIHQLSMEQSESLVDAALDFSTLDELQAWLQLTSSP